MSFSISCFIFLGTSFTVFPFLAPSLFVFKYIKFLQERVEKVFYCLYDFEKITEKVIIQK